MKSIAKMITASAAALSAFALVAMAAPSAQAGEYCMTNTSGMRGCGYATIEQCQASAAGGLGTCGRDPFYADSSNALTNNALPNNALAYQPKSAQSRGALRAAKQSVEH
jgi:hypothetical protein